jgi:hypothetical protein
VGQGPPPLLPCVFSLIGSLVWSAGDPSAEAVGDSAFASSPLTEEEVQAQWP